MNSIKVLFRGWMNWRLVMFVIPDIWVSLLIIIAIWWTYEGIIAPDMEDWD